MQRASVYGIDICSAGATGEVIPVEIATAKAIAIARPLHEAECLRLELAVGRILAADVRASIDLPPFENSAMDGYAIRLGSLRGEPPWRLRVVGRVAAGDAALAAVPGVPPAIVNAASVLTG